MPHLTTEEQRARQRELGEAVALLRQFVAEWRGPGLRPPHLVVDQDPRNGVTTVHLHALLEQVAYILAAVRVGAAASAQGGPAE